LSRNSITRSATDPHPTQAALNYLVDTFTEHSASAIAATTFLRSTFAGAFPLFITPMLEKMGIPLGMSVFAAVAVLLMPVPYLFYFKGESIRARGKWSRESVNEEKRGSVESSRDRADEEAAR